MADLHLRKKALVVLIALSVPAVLLAQTTKVTINAAFPPLSYLSFPGTQYASDFLKYVASSPLVDGVNPPLLWSMVDRGPSAPGGQYDWTTFDAAIQPYIKLGKTINLTVWSISETGVNSDNFSNAATPAYVMKLVDTVTCPEFPGNGTRTGAYPVVWEMPFQRYYKQFITEVLRHFEGNPHIGYIRFGLTGGAAVYPTCEAELTKFLPAGQSFMQTILTFDKSILDYEKSQNPAFPIIAPFAEYNNQLNYSHAEAANGIEDGFGLGYQGLRASDITDVPACSSDWCHLLGEYSSIKPTPPFELQPVGQSDPSATCTPSCFDGDQQQTGSLPPLLLFAVEHHASILEIYSTDLLLALDPNYPGYSEYHTAYEHALAAIHAGKSSSVTLSPTSLDFGTFRTGTSSAPQAIAVINTGVSAITFPGTAPVTVAGDYSETDDCAFRVLPPGQQCVISVVFKPSAIGKRGGLLTIHNNDPWSPQTVGLLGRGEN